jgi:uncharacterized protein YcnI
MKLRTRMLGAAGLAAALMVGAAAPALAHVTTDPDSSPKGGEITLGFRVPNEEDSANVSKVEIDFPTDHPLLGVLPQPEAGWTDAVNNVTLNPPIQTDDGPVSSAVSQIVWTGSIAPGHFYEFHVLVQRLPTDVDQTVFKAVQTYSNGDVVRWIDPVVAGQKAPDHPTPILTLTAAASDTGSTTATTAAGTSSQAINVSKLAKKSSVDGARTVAIIGLIVGALGLIVGVVAVTGRRRPAGPAE